MEFEAVIGLEIHIQLKTESKLFCSCPNEFGAPPNTLVCPVCLGLPGALPVLNEKAVQYALVVASALGMKINRNSVFYRKNYFYPDLPKGYQITQYTESIATDGRVNFEVDGKEYSVGIERINIEEESAKSIHEGGYVLVDFNRSGVPLLEVVTYPEMRSAKMARSFLENLRRIIRYLGVSSCDMEKGELRVDSNISIREKGTKTMGVKVELKNLNSFKAVEDGLNYEFVRQKKLLSSQNRVEQETRLWDEFKKVSKPMREKEEAHDYRYFPEPDLLPLRLDDEILEKARSMVVELPDIRRKRFIEEFNIPKQQADILTASMEIANYFEYLAKLTGDGVLSANWIVTEVLRVLKEKRIEIKDFPISPPELAELLRYIKRNEITHNIAKEVFRRRLEEDKPIEVIIKEGGYTQLKDEDILSEIIKDTLEAHPDIVDKFRKGKEGVLGVLIGDVMKKTQGKANAELVKKLILKKIADKNS